MSYLLDAAAESLTGALGTTYADPLTIGIFVKTTDHNTSADQIVAALRNASGSNNDSYRISTVAATDNRWYAQSRDSGGSTNQAVLTGSVDAATVGTTYNATSGWFGVIATFASDTSRTLRIGSYANANTESTSRIVADAVGFLRVGGDFGAVAIPNRVAEVAVWNASLSQSDIEAYLAGTSADQIAAANLLCYFPLAANPDAHSAGTDSIASLTPNGATLDEADHPTITGATTKYLKLKVHPSASTANAVAGAVWSAPTGGNITGSTKYGEFSGKEFEAGTGDDEGYAVLLVPTTDISPDGGTLATNQEPVAIARNADYSTTIIPGIVVEV